MEKKKVQGLTLPDPFYCTILIPKQGHTRYKAFKDANGRIKIQRKEISESDTISWTVLTGSQISINRQWDQQATLKA